MTQQYLNLPVIDLADSKYKRKEFAAKIVDSLENIGFLFVDNVPGLDYDKLYQCNQWFFQQPDDVKKRLTRKAWNPENNNVYRGYFPVVPTEPSRKEAFEFAKDVLPGSVSPDNWFYEKSVWPKENGEFPFKKTLCEFYELMHKTALELLSLCALGLGLPEDYFEYMFRDKPMSTFRLLHYPPWDSKPVDSAKIEDGKLLVTPDHADTEYLTLLATFNYSGLEILTSDGKWAEITPRPHSLVINIGETFAKMTGGRFKATRHRVIDIGVDRYSTAFFFTPSFDTDVGFNILDTKREANIGKEELFGPYQLRRMKYEKKYFEFRDLPDILFL